MTVQVVRGGDRRGVRLTRRGRIVLRLALGIVATVGVVLLVDVRSGAQDTLRSPQWRAAVASGQALRTEVHIRVVPGDTLWGIATRIHPEADPRAVVEALAEANGLDSPVIHPGQRLILPATPLAGDQ